MMQTATARVCWPMPADQHTRAMAHDPFRPCDFCGTRKAPRPWMLIDTTRKMACPTCTPAALAEARKARKVLKRYRHLIGRRLMEEPSPMYGMQLHNNYRRIKAQYPDAVLLFRTGDTYNALDLDARLLHQVLSLQLHSYQPYGVDRASFPAHALEDYLPKLVRAGHRVAICDQPQQDAHDTDVATMGAGSTVSEPLSRYERIERKRTEERFTEIITVLERYKAVPRHKGLAYHEYVKECARATEQIDRNIHALRAELRLHRVWLTKHRWIQFGLNGTKCKCNPQGLPILLSDYRRNSSGKPFYFRDTTGKAPEHAIGNFDSDADAARTLACAEHNLAEALEHALAVPALIDHWKRHLQQVRQRMGLHAVQAGGHSVQPHAQAA